MRALGLMSGTSADGVSLALVDGKRVVDYKTYPYSRSLQKRILAAPKAEATELCRLDFELGRLYASAAKRFLGSRRVDVVGSHGQTIVHLPDDRFPSTLQIGEASFLAEALKVPVVSDFRPRDIAAGGQGAPLIPFFDEFLFGNGPKRALQNVGGIANVAVVGKGVKTYGFDTGPGNCLLDLAVSKLTRGRMAFDRGGKLALAGWADLALVGRLSSAPYFKKRPPKSLDRGTFGEAYLKNNFLNRRWRLEDLAATLTMLTAKTIADAAPKGVAEMIVSGGGALNNAMLRALRILLAPMRVRTIDEFGIPALAKEPAAMAVMAMRAIKRKTNHCPRATGARSARILGKIA